MRPSGFGGGWLGSGIADGASIKASNESTSARAGSEPEPDVDRGVEADRRLCSARRPHQELLVQCRRSAPARTTSTGPMSARAAARCRSPSIRGRHLGQAGLATYAIDFKQEGTFTVVRTANRNMPPDLAAKMQYDIERWKRGEYELQQANAQERRGLPPRGESRGSRIGAISLRDIPECGSRAGRGGRACRSNAASSGTHRPSACSARKPLRG